MSKERATKKQQEMYQFVKKFLDDNDYAPSYREIMAALGYKSVSTVAAHIDGLVAKGFLRRNEGSARSIDLAKPASVEKPGVKKSLPAIEPIANAVRTVLKDKPLTNEKQRAIGFLLEALVLLNESELADELKKEYDHAPKESVA